MEEYLSEKLDFLKNFDFLKKKKIVLYGIGRYTAALLSFDLPFQFVGLLDRDVKNAGKVIYGLPVLKLEEVKAKADVIIINTSEAYWETIYNRIKEIDIPVFFRNGTKAENKQQDAANEAQNFGSFDELKTLVQNYEVISFDFYDSLVMRRVAFNSDVSELIDREIRKRGMDNIPFSEMRKYAAASAGKNATLNQIYDILIRQKCISIKQAEILKGIELEIESSLLIPRNEIFQLFQSLIAAGKEIYIISDMYLPSEFYREALVRFGVNMDSTHIWISSEKKCSKRDGSMWKIFSGEILRGRKGLHIGDDKEADIVQARQYGLDTFLIRSSLNIAQHSILGKLLPKISGIEDSIAMGLIITKLFNSPFVFKNSHSTISFENAETFGYAVYGYVFYTFLNWLIQKSEDLKISVLFFFAREGYFLCEDFAYLLKKTGRNKPDAEYLEISRRAIMNASVCNKEDWEEIVRFPYTGIFKEYMYNRFRVELKTSDPNRDKQINAISDWKKIEEWTKPYENEMKKNLTEEKKGYTDYIKQIIQDENFAVVDSWYYGHTQFFLSKLLKKSLAGFYMAFNNSAENKCTSGNTMYGCFQKEDDSKAEKSCLWKKALITESFLTAPIGMLRYIDENGRKVYDEKKENQNHFHTKVKINAGIKEFICDLADIVYMPYTDNLSGTNFADQLFGCFMDGNCILSEEIKNSFWSDNGIVNEKEYRIFE